MSFPQLDIIPRKRPAVPALAGYDETTDVKTTDKFTETNDDEDDDEDAKAEAQLKADIGALTGNVVKPKSTIPALDSPELTSTNLNEAATKGFADENSEAVNKVKQSVNSKGQYSNFDPANSDAWDFVVNIGDDPYAIKAEKQSGFERHLNTALRFIPGTAGKLIDMVGFLGGGAAAAVAYPYDKMVEGMSGGEENLMTRKDYYDVMYDNPIVRGGKAVQHWADDSFKIYERESYKNAGAFERMTYSENVPKVGDGVQFLASIIVADLGIAAIGIGSKISGGVVKNMVKNSKDVENATGFLKLFNNGKRLSAVGKVDEAAAAFAEASKLGNLTARQLKSLERYKKLGDVLPIHIANTTSESMAEAHGIYDEMKHEVAKLQGTINPKTGEIYTASELETMRLDATGLSFMYNMAVLSVTNLPETVGILSAISGTEKYLTKTAYKTVLKKAQKSTIGKAYVNASTKVNATVGKSNLGILAQKFGGTIFNSKAAHIVFGGLTTAAIEGMLEENSQLAIQNGVKDAEFGLSELGARWIENFSTVEGVEAMLLGATIGFLPGGVGNMRSKIREKAAEERNNSIQLKRASLIGATPELYVTKLNKKTGETEYIYDAHGNKIVNVAAVEAALLNSVSSNAADLHLANGILTGDITLIKQGLRSMFASTALTNDLMPADALLEGEELNQYVEDFIGKYYALYEAKASQSSGFSAKEFAKNKQEMVEDLKIFAETALNQFKSQSLLIENDKLLSGKSTAFKRYLSNTMYNNIITRYNSNELINSYQDRIDRSYDRLNPNYQKARYNALLNLYNEVKNDENANENVIYTVNRLLTRAYDVVVMEAPEGTTIPKNEQLPLHDAITPQLDNVMNLVVQQIHFLSSEHYVNMVDNIDVIEAEYDALIKQQEKDNKDSHDKNFEIYKAKFNKDVLSITADKDANLYQNGVKLDKEGIRTLKEQAKALDFMAKNKKNLVGFKVAADNKNQAFLTAHVRKVIELAGKQQTIVTPATKLANDTKSKLIISSNKITLDNQQVVYVKDAVQFRRQSNFTKRPSTKDTSEAEIENDKAHAAEYAAEVEENGENEILIRGNAVDFVGKNILSGTNVTYDEIQNSAYDVFESEDAFNAYVEYFKLIRAEIEQSGGTIVSDITLASLNNGNPVAGETDVLVIDKDGNVHIYDIKSTKTNDKVTNAKGYTKQLAVYKALIENTLGLKVTGTSIISINAKDVIVGNKMKLGFDSDSKVKESIIPIDVSKTETNITIDPNDVATVKPKDNKPAEETLTTEKVLPQFLTLLQARQGIFNKLMHSEFTTYLKSLMPNVNMDELSKFVPNITNLVHQQVGLLVQNIEDYDSIIADNVDFPILKTSYSKYFESLFKYFEVINAKKEKGEVIDDASQRLLDVRDGILTFIADNVGGTEAEQLVAYDNIKRYLITMDEQITESSSSIHKVTPSLISIVKNIYNGFVTKNLNDSRISDSASVKLHAKIKAIGSNIVGFIIDNNNKKQDLTFDDFNVIIGSLFKNISALDFTSFDSNGAYVDAVTDLINEVHTVLANSLYVPKQFVSLFNSITKNIVNKLNVEMNRGNNLGEIVPTDQDFMDDFVSEFGSSSSNSLSVWISTLDKNFIDANNNTPYTVNSNGTISMNNKTYDNIYGLLNDIQYGTTVRVANNDVFVTIDNKEYSLGKVNNPEYLYAEFSLLSTLNEHVVQDKRFVEIKSLIDSVNNLAAVTDAQYEDVYTKVMSLLNEHQQSFFSSTGVDSMSNLKDGNISPSSYLARHSTTFKSSVNGGRYLARALKRGRVNPQYIAKYGNDIKFLSDMSSGKTTSLQVSSTSSGSIVKLTNNGVVQYEAISDIVNIDDIINNSGSNFIGLSQKDVSEISSLTDRNRSFNTRTEPFKKQSLFLVTKGINGELTQVPLKHRRLNDSDTGDIISIIHKLQKLFNGNTVPTKDEVLSHINDINDYIPYSNKINGAARSGHTFLTFDEFTNNLTISLRGGIIEASFAHKNNKIAITPKDTKGNAAKQIENVPADNEFELMQPIITSTVKNIDFDKLQNDLTYRNEVLTNGSIVLSAAPVMSSTGTKLGIFHPEGEYPYTMRITNRDEVTTDKPSEDGIVEDDIFNMDLGDTFDSGIDTDNSIVDSTDINALVKLNTINKDAANAWLQEKLGDAADVSWFNSYLMNGNNIIEGSVSFSSIKLGNYASFGTEFHEAFHIVYNNLITAEERAEVITEAKDFYNTDDIDVIMELLAEDYRAWEINRLNVNFKLPARIIQMFKDILRRVKLIENNTVVIQDLFNRISNNEFNSKVVNTEYENYYTRDEEHIDLPVVVNSIPGFNYNERNSASLLLTQITSAINTTAVNIHMGTNLTPFYRQYASITVQELHANPKLSLSNILVNQLKIKQQHLKDTAKKQIVKNPKDKAKIIKSVTLNLEFLNGIIADIRSNTGTESLMNDTKLNMSKYQNINMIEHEDLIAMETTEDYKLTRMFTESAFKESAERNFKAVTKSIIARGVEYTYDENGMSVPVLDSYTGLPKPIDYELVYPKLQDIFLNITSIEDMREVMSDAASYYPTMQQYINILNKGSQIDASGNKTTNLEAAWFTDFNKTTLDEIGILVPKTSHITPNKGLTKLNNSYGDLIVRSLYSNLNVQFNSVTTDTDTFDSIRGEVNTILSGLTITLSNSAAKRPIVFSAVARSEKETGVLVKTYVEQLVILGKAYGIESLTADVILNYLNDSNPKLNSEPSTLGKLEHIKNQLNKLIAPGKNLKFDSNAIYNLSHLISRYGNGQINYSYRDFEGNLKYGVSKNNLITDILNHYNSLSEHDLIMYLLKLATVEGLNHSNLIAATGEFSLIKPKQGVILKRDELGNVLNPAEDLMVNKDNLNALKLNLYGGIKIESTNKVNGYLDQTDISWAYSAMSLYANSVSSDVQSTGNNIVRTLLPVFGDSSNHYVIARQRLPLSSKHITFKDGTVTLNPISPIYTAMVNTVKQDASRIIGALSIMYDGGVLKSDDVLDSLDLIENYHYVVKDGRRIYREQGKLTGGVFKFGNINTIDFDAYVNNGVLNTALLNTHMSTHINMYINNMYNKTKPLYSALKDEMQYTQRGVKELKSSPYDSHFGENAWETLVIEQQLNTYLNNVESQLLFSGSHASQLTHTNVTKRAKKAIQFGEQGSSKKDFVNIVVNDRFVGNEQVIKLYKGLFKDMGVAPKKQTAILDNYKSNVESSDGWSLMSLNHWVKIMKHFGKFSDVESLLNVDDSGNYTIRKNLTIDELSNLIQVLKPIYVENKPHTITTPEGISSTVMNNIYHKTSTFVPTELFANIDSEMEELMAFMSKNKVDNITFKSARKDGAKRIATIFDENGQLNLNDVTNNIETYSEILNMTNYKLQLHVPDDIRNTKIKVGVQFYKHVIGNIRATDTYVSPKGYGFKQDITGVELKEQHFDIFDNIIKRDAEKLFNELGGEVSSNGSLMLANHNKFYNKFIGEAKARNYSTNDKNSVTYTATSDIELDNEEQLNSVVLTNDFSFGTNAKKSTSLFTSLFTNGVTNTKFSGGHLVLLSEAINNSSKKFTDLGEVIYDEGLKAEYIDGVLYVDAKIPAWSNDFINEDGKLIDINDIDPRVLKLIGYRVPISTKHSSVVIRVVGFTEVTSGSVAILPAHLITQTGWDFDVDSLFVMTPNHKVVKNKIEYFDYRKIEYGDYVLNRIQEIATNVPALNRLLGERFDAQQAIAEIKEEKYKLIANKPNIPASLQEDMNASKRITEINKQLKLSQVDYNTSLKLKHELTELINRVAGNTELTEFKSENSTIDLEIKGLNVELREYYDTIARVNKELIVGLDKRNLLMSKAEFKIKRDININDVLSRKQLQNKIINVWSLLLSQNNGLLERIETSSFDNNVRVRDNINDAIETFTGINPAEELNSTNPADQIRIHNLIIGGKAMLNIAANADAITTIFEHTQATLTTGIEINYDTNDLDIANELYGSENIKGGVATHNQLGWTKDGNNVSMDDILINFNIAEDVDHSVDSATKKMIRNINTTTFPVSIMMKSVGIKNSYIGYFMNQYVINKLLSLQNETNNLTAYSENAAVLTERSLLTDIIVANGREKEYSIKGNYVQGKLSVIRANLVKNGIDVKVNTTGVSPAKMKALFENQYVHFNYNSSPIDPTDTSDEKINFLLTQLNMLDMFNHIAEISNAAIAESSKLNADKINASGSFEVYADLIDMVENEKRDDKGKVIPPTITSNGVPILTAVYKHNAYPILKQYYELGVVVPFNTLRNFYSTQSNSIRDSIINPFKQDYKKFNRNFDNDLKSFEQHILFHFMSDFNLFNGTSENIYNRMGIRGNSKDSAVASLIKYQALPEAQKPAFIDYLTFKTYEAGGKTPYIKMVDDVSRDLLPSIHSSITDMYDNGGKDKAFVEKLVLFAYISEGFAYGKNNLSLMLPQTLFAKMGLVSSNNNASGYMTDVLINSKLGNISLEYETVIDDFLLTNVNNNTFIPYVRAKSGKNTNIPFGEMMKATVKNAGQEFTVTLSNLKKESTAIQNARFIKHTYRVKVKGSTESKQIMLIFKRSEVTKDTIDVTYTKVDTQHYIPYMRKPVVNTVIMNTVDIMSRNDILLNKKPC